MTHLKPHRATAALTTLFAVLLFTLSAFPVLATEPNNSPEQIVTELITAMQNNAADQIRAAFADDASQRYDRWYGMKKTGDKFRQWLESDIIKVHGRVDNPVINAVGAEVVVTGTYKNNDNYSSPANFLLTVKDGKITSWTMRYD